MSKQNKVPEDVWEILQHKDFSVQSQNGMVLSTWNEYFLQNNSGMRTIKASHDSLQAELNLLIQNGDKRIKEVKKVISIQGELKVICATSCSDGVGKKSVWSPEKSVMHLPPPPQRPAEVKPVVKRSVKQNEEAIKELRNENVLLNNRIDVLEKTISRGEYDDPASEESMRESKKQKLDDEVNYDWYK
ncbi:8066_t:CDS:2 [Funneliformis mosseae]|uniref:8066_t:CDS:1 n=1 Tax=Funneliformis mosseae TaxID=27381 RepID=A0A9N9C7X8_FUNMO|nr:8066_t:CDS:2 [Funneliformis mosseae]